MALSDEPARTPGPSRFANTADISLAVACIVATFALFYIDSISPRGVIDGIGYPAVVALSARFGRRALLGWSVLCTALIGVAHFLLPNVGISLSGELANRGFGVVSIWIIAYVMNRRLLLEAVNRQRTATLRRNQVALSRIVRETLASDRLLADRLRVVTEIAADALQVDIVAVFRYFEDNPAMHCLDLYHRGMGQHLQIDDLRGPRTPQYEQMMLRDGMMATSDLDLTEMSAERRAFARRFDVHAMMAAGVIIDNQLTGQLAFMKSGKTYDWTEQDAAFARAVGNIVTWLLLWDFHRQALTALDAVNEAIYIEDRGGATVYANKAALALAESDSAAGTLQKVRLPRPLLPLSSERDHSLEKFGQRELDIRRSRLPDGGIITRLNDVTQQNEQLRERERLQARLQQSEKVEAIGQLAGGVAHDFNNIVGAIMGFAGFLIQDIPEGSEQHEFAKRILAAAQRAKELIEQILTFARMRPSSQDVTDVQATLEGTLDILRGTLPPLIRLETFCDPGAMLVQCSGPPLSQLFLNLCMNAREAIGDRDGAVEVYLSTAPGSEAVATASRIGEDEITVGEAHAATSYARVRVKDSGAGIERDALRSIFDPFYTTKGRQRGTGLGLAVVHGVIMGCGGFMHVRSRPGYGSEFTVYVPLAAVQAKPAQADPVRPAPAQDVERIMVVDDEPDMVDMMVIGLERLGFQAVGVGDPLDALAAFEEDPAAFDVIVTDLVMPSLLGSELVRKTKAIRPDVRAIICTAFSDGTAEPQSMTADAFFRKPVDALTIATCIRGMRARAAPIAQPATARQE